jgi:hypothetical protein
MYARGQYVRSLGEVVKIASVTLPKLSLPDLDIKAIEAEAREAAAKVKTIRAGRDAWEAINKSASFESYLAIGAALAVGKTHALRVSRANAAWGRNYSREFGIWMDRHGFAAMPKSTRSVSIELHEHAEAITAWRNSLPERQRKRLVHPLSVTRRWRTAMAFGEAKCPQDLKREAASAWRRFRSCLEGLPADVARPLWQSVTAEATTHVS